MKNAICLLPMLLLGQDIATLFPVTRAGDKWVAQNAGAKAITAYVIHAGGGPLRVSRTQMNVAPGEFENYPIAPGATVEIPAKPGIQILEIPALVFEDGTVVGSARTVEGLDVVDEIFRYRQEEYKALQRLASLLGDANHDRGLTSLRQEAQRPLRNDNTANSEELTGMRRAYGHIQGFLNAPNSEELYATLQQELARRLAVVGKSCTRRAQ